jgi:YVTN family beta-propeller protein
MARARQVAVLLTLSAAVAAIGVPSQNLVNPTSSTSAGRAYVVGRTGLVQVLDTRHGTILSTADTTGRATGVAVSPDGERLYVVNGWSGSIAVVNPHTGAIIDRMHTQVQLSQAAMRPDGERLYITAAGSVAVVEPQTFRLIAAIRVGGQPQGLAVTQDGRKLYVANAQDGTISVVDTETASQTRTIAVGGLPQQVALSPDGAFLYVSGMRLGKQTTGTVSIIDTARGSVVGSIPVGKGAGPLAVTPDGSALYLSLPKERLVAVIDVVGKTVRKMLSIDAPGVATAPGDRRIFLATGSTTTVLDSSDDAVLRRYSLSSTAFSGPRSRDFDAALIVFPPNTG